MPDHNAAPGPGRDAVAASGSAAKSDSAPRGQVVSMKPEDLRSLTDRWVREDIQQAGVLVVDGELGPLPAVIADRIRTINALTLAVQPGSGPDSACFDVIIDERAGVRGAVSPDFAEGARDRLLQAAVEVPDAALVLVQLLRATAGMGVADGLRMESLAYSLLQTGARHQSWLASRQRPRQPVAERPLVSLRRDADVLTVTLEDPASRNAFGARMRDDLLDALDVAVADERVRVVLKGAGTAFSSGGHLGEFGTGGTALDDHAVRTGRSVGQALHQLRPRVRAQVHGWCVGAGIELPAFTAHISAAPGTRFRLPELDLGLIPGAGGTVSIPRRIGRQRTAAWALTGEVISDETALAWGLIDAIST